MEAIGGFAVFIMVLAVFAVIFIAKSVRVVPQQEAWVVERFGKFHTVLQPGLNFIIPIIDRVAYRQTLKEIPMDTSSQICITKDNTQLQVDGVLYFQVTNPELASYGTSDFVMAITQLAQTSLRSVIGTMSLDKTFEEREEINARVVQAVDEAAQTWGVKVLRYEIKDLTPPKEILRAMQLQITAEREKRAVIATSEGQKQKEINIAEGERAAMIAQSEGEKKMDEIVKRDLPIVREEMDRDEAVKYFNSIGEHYKAEIIGSIPAGETISLYRQGDYVDLCRGPHVPSTGRLRVHKLMKLAGAYWRGDSKNEMLQRIYGTAWASLAS
jgi:regulator of protease activity HflC (stomatin/prohibitin superfamily)